MDDNARNGYKNIRVNLKVKGDVPESILTELVELAQAHSPVYDIVANQVPISVQIEA